MTLTIDPSSKWASWNRGKPVNAQQVAQRLAEFGIKPTNIRFPAGVFKGYVFDHFSDAFERYLPSVPPPNSGAGTDTV